MTKTQTPALDTANVSAKSIITLGKAGSVEVDASRFTQNVVEYVFNYGLKQMLNDAHASVTALTNPDEADRAAAKVAMAEKKLMSLYAGNVAQAREGGGSRQSPLDKALQDIAESTLRKAVKAKGKKMGDEDIKSNWKRLVQMMIEKNRAEWLPQAQAMVDAAQTPEEIIDLDDLMGA